MEKKDFLKRLSVFALAIAAGIFAVQRFQNRIAIDNLVWAALVYFFLLSLSTWLITRSGLSKSNKTFITRTYSAIGIRFIFSIFPLAIYLFFYDQYQISFVIAYVLMYFLFTSFEIYFLVITLRPDSKKNDP